MWILLLIFVGLLVWGVISEVSAVKNGEAKIREMDTIKKYDNKENKNVTVHIYDVETNRIIMTGYGYTIGQAVVDGFWKMVYDLSDDSKVDTLKSRIESMDATLSRNRYKMDASDIRKCANIIDRTRKMLENKQQETAKKEQEAAIKEQEAIKEEQEMSEHRRFVAEQRRLMKDSLRYDVLRRDNFRCQLCGATAQDGVKLHVDHIIPVSKGGRTEMSNLRTLCERCNLGKRDKIENMEEEHTA